MKQALNLINFMKKFSSISFIFFIFLNIFILATTFYKSEIVHLGLNRDHYINYYIFSFSFIIVIVCIQIFNNKIKNNIYLILFSCLTSIVIFETCLEFKIDKIWKRDNTNFENNPYEYISNQKSKNSYIPRILPGSLLPNGLANSIFPASSISSKNTVMCKENSGMITYFSDRFGFNNEDNVWENNNSAILTGDSFVHGDCVKRNNNISGNLEKLNNSKKFINLGMGGNGPLLKLLSLREFGFLNKTNNVLWFYFEGNDFIELEFEKSSKILNSYLNDKNFTQNLHLKTAVVDKEFLKIHQNNIIKQKFLHNLKRKIKNILFLKNIRNLFNSLNLMKASYPFDIIKYNKIIQMAQNLTKLNNANFYFIYLPAFERFTKKNRNHDFFLNKKILIDKVRENGVFVIDISNLVFERNSDPLQFFPNRQNGHYNEKGYMAISQKLNEIIEF